MNPRVALLALLLTWPCQSSDEAVLRAVQAPRSGALHEVARAVSDRSRLALAVGAGVAILAGGATRAATLEAALVLVPVNLVVEGLKRATFRARPDGEHRRSNASFPSSHAANAFAVAAVIARRWRRSGVVALLLAAVVGWSRLYLNRHWPSDVLAGAVLGVGLALLTLLAWRRWRASRNVAATP